MFVSSERSLTRPPSQLAKGLDTTVNPLHKQQRHNRCSRVPNSVRTGRPQRLKAFGLSPEVDLDSAGCWWPWRWNVRMNT